jgi:peptidoglycan hydrolase-like protein with peptidoglycan-binding domain
MPWIQATISTEGDISMRKKARRAIFAITAASLVAVGAAAAGGASGGGSPAPQHIALAGQQAVGFGINLDNCPVLAKGYTGGCASQLQAELRAAIDPGLVIDGDFGEATRQAVIAFQEQQHIVPADGVAGPETKAALDAVAAGSPGTLQSPSGPAPSTTPPTPAGTAPSTPGTPSAPAGQLSYAALGDSYSAGEGLAEFLPATDLAPYSCDRSDQAYSQYVTPKPDAFIACSGQKIAGLNGVVTAPGSPVNASTGLITLTIGGNDLDWASTVKSCLRVEAAVFHFTLAEDSAACTQKLDDARTRLASLQGDLTATYKLLLTQAPNAQIRVLTYPPIFPDRGNSTSGCRVGRAGPAQVVIPAAIEQQFMNLEQQANLAIIRAVQSIQTSSADGNRIQWVDVESQFGGYLDTGHTISCGATGRPTPWVNAVRLDGVQEAVLADEAARRQWGQLLQDWSNAISPASFHPTHEGQHEMYLALARDLPSGWS